MSSLLPDPGASLLDRIKTSMVGLKMPRAIEIVDACVGRLDHGEITALEAIEQLLLEELTFRENRRIKTALVMGADSDDRAQPFRHDAAQRSEMIAISSGHPVDMDWVSVSKVSVNR